MRIRIQPNKICKKLLDKLKYTKKIAQNLKTMELVRIYLIFYEYNKITISTNFLAIFLFFPKNFPFLDPDTCGSGSTALHLSVICQVICQPYFEQQ